MNENAPDDWPHNLNESILKLHCTTFSHQIFRTSNIVKYAFYASLHHVISIKTSLPWQHKLIDHWMSFVDGQFFCADENVFLH